MIPEAHIGLIRNHHTYNAEITIIHSLGADIVAKHPQHNIYIKVVDISPTQELVDSSKDRYSSTVTVEVKTLKEGNIGEQIEIVSKSDDTRYMEVLVTAQVLLTNQGNPVLKNGVHLVSHQHEDESDFTEWPKHDRDGD